jgi:hypothetical protein
MALSSSALSLRHLTSSFCGQLMAAIAEVADPFLDPPSNPGKVPRATPDAGAAAAWRFWEAPFTLDLQARA